MEDRFDAMYELDQIRDKLAETIANIRAQINVVRQQIHETQVAIFLWSVQLFQLNANDPNLLEKEQVQLLQEAQKRLDELKATRKKLLSTLEALRSSLDAAGKKLADVEEKINSLRFTFQCQPSVLDSFRRTIKECACEKTHVDACRPNAELSACVGICSGEVHAAIQRNLDQLVQQRDILDAYYGTLNKQSHTLESEGAAVKQKLAGLKEGEPEYNRYIAMLRLNEDTSSFVRSEKSTSFEAILDLSLDIIKQQETLSQTCKPTLVNPNAGFVLQCGCLSAQDTCRPDPTRTKCTDFCPAKDPKLDCSLKRDEKLIGKPGVDSRGACCGGGCAGPSSVCIPVRDKESGFFTGCQCGESFVTVPKAEKDQSCIPAKYDASTEFVHSCRCVGTCRVALNPVMAGRRDLGYDDVGLFCSGVCGDGRSPCRPTFDIDLKQGFSQAYVSSQPRYRLKECVCPSESTCPAENTLLVSTTLPQVAGADVCKMAAEVPLDSPALAKLCERETKQPTTEVKGLQLIVCTPIPCGGDKVCYFNITHEVCCPDPIPKATIQTVTTQTVTQGLNFVKQQDKAAVAVGFSFLPLADDVNQEDLACLSSPSVTPWPAQRRPIAATSTCSAPTC